MNDLAGELEATRLAVPRAETALREARRRIEERQLSFRAEAQRELNAIQAEATALHEVITAAADQVQPDRGARAGARHDQAAVGQQRAAA